MKDAYDRDEDEDVYDRDEDEDEDECEYEKYECVYKHFIKECAKVMAVSVGFLVFGLIAVALYPCLYPNEKIVQDPDKRFILDVWYIKDPRTNICFAYNRGLATVPCEAIPSDMLAVPNLNP